MGVGAWWSRWRASVRRRRVIDACLDDLFTRPERMTQARLAPRHRGRVVVLEADVDGDRVARLLFGIVRHPKAHPLAARGDEVLEIVEYDVVEGTLEVAGARNLTRRPFGRE